MAIRSFRDRLAEAVFGGRCPKGFPADIFRTARRKLAYLDAAERLDVLHARPAIGSKLWSAIVSASIRSASTTSSICFLWTADGPHSVEITDYH